MSDAFEFGAYCLHPRARILQKDNVAVPLGSRAFDILVALVRSDGNVLTHRELMATAWPGMIIETSNVRVQIGHLRRALGCGKDGVRYIASIAGRGYYFAAAVRPLECPEADLPPVEAPALIVSPGVPDSRPAPGSWLDLPELPRQLLCQLAVFAGPFSLDDVIAVLSDDDDRAGVLSEAFAGLVDQALVVPHAQQGRLLFTLSAPAKTWVAAHPASADTHDGLRRRHALWYLEQARRYANEHALTDNDASPADLPDVDNVLAAMNGYLSSHADSVLSASIGYSVARLLLVAGRLRECRRCCQRCLAGLGKRLHGTAVEIELLELLAVVGFAQSDYGAEVTDAMQQGLELSRSTGDLPGMFNFMAGLHLALMINGEFQRAAELSERYAAECSLHGGEAERVISYWLTGSADHYLGNQLLAQSRFGDSAELAKNSKLRSLRYFELRQRNFACATSARVALLRGMPVQALRSAFNALGEARRRPDAFYLCLALCFEVLMHNGRDEQAGRLLQEFDLQPAEYQAGFDPAVTLALQCRLLSASGASETGAHRLWGGLEQCGGYALKILETEAWQTLCESLRHCGHGFEALVAINQAIDLAKKSGGVCNLADLLRNKAEVLLDMPGLEHGVIDDVLSRAMQCARQQSALFWELRVALVAAGAARSTRRSTAAKDGLRGVYYRFTEGFELRDLKLTRRAIENV
ncbi:winged helix-turn-helix domain-containing protein [Pseudomonas sp. NPDC090202]|uniref:winged helix-turn-helix domain-containing protein n=1 Tax=unclassified Pseudomonas TaxID=196821 RepID=UPI00381AAF03